MWEFVFVISPVGAVLGREGEGQVESRGEGEEERGGAGYSGDTGWEAGQGNSSPLFTVPCTHVAGVTSCCTGRRG